MYDTGMVEIYTVNYTETIDQHWLVIHMLRSKKMSETMMERIWKQKKEHKAKKMILLSTPLLSIFFEVRRHRLFSVVLVFEVCVLICRVLSLVC